ncbi:MAG: 16S rRNA (cytosine(1402)-N(4))-methyltransferase RsmH [Pirellulales bacterium]|nr:16S rRNA (cytosine(1402)-N(4))-methyltransferase RsmH [Pirellulales bacterium]
MSTPGEKSDTPSSPVHVPVLVDEVLEWLAPKSDMVILDGTLGGGGHARLLAERVAPDGRVIALDRDEQAVTAAASRLHNLPVEAVHGSYADAPEILASLDIGPLDSVLLDLGLSSDQLADDQRGFSFDADGPLDLRFDTSTGDPAWRLLERLSEKHLADLIFAYGEERHSRRIARRIVAARREEPIRTAAELARVVRSCMPRHAQRIDPATRTFQALRIAVNGELDAIDTALRRLPNLLKPGGRIAVISFHSLEDRPVKEAFRDNPHLTPLTKKPIQASEAELERNPRARSAKLRVAERSAD